MKSSNPVLGRLEAAAQQNPRYTVPGPGATVDGSHYGQPQVVQTGSADVMTIDDVVVKTVSLLGATALSGAITFALLPDSLLRPVWIGAALIGFVLGLVISFAQITNPVLLFTYALIEGAFLGAVSKYYETAFNGIVIQAVVATLGTFLIMAALYRAKIIRATPKFMKVVIGMAAGLAVVMLVNFVISMITGEVSPLRNGGPIAIIFSLICITVAAFMLVVSFKQIEDGIAAGLPRKYGWIGAFGILVELIWLYLEFLRLISYFSGDD